MIRGKAELLGHSGLNSREASGLFESPDDEDRIHREEPPYVLKVRIFLLSIWRQGKSVSIKSGQNSAVGERISSVIAKLGLTQATFAKRLNVGQGNVSKWVRNANRPSPDLMARIAGIAPDEDKFFFLEQAGVPKEYFLGGLEKKLPSPVIEAVDAVVSKAFYGNTARPKIDALLVPVLADAVAAGDPLLINERDIAMVLPLPTSWLPKSGALYALRIEGDSMEPKLSDGDLAIVDVSRRDPDKLNKAMIAARVGDGVTVKYLRRNGVFWQLVPQHVSPRHEIRILTEDDDWSVVGEVVKCIVNPPSPTRRK